MPTDHVRWTGWDGAGLEHCAVHRSSDHVLIEGTVVGDRGGTPYGAYYRVRCDREWRTREVQLAYVGGLDMHVMADGEGNWFDHGKGDDPAGEPLPELAGCIDVDIGVTPATNMLPIGRLALAEGEARAIRAAYVPLPSQIEGNRLLPRPADQRYTCLVPAKRYRYEGLFRDFTAELAIDERGIVLDYPDTFRRA